MGIAERATSKCLHDGYLVGPPDLVVEVSASSASHDLGSKMNVYRRNGVREYVVWQILEERIDWFRLSDGAYEPVAPGATESSKATFSPGSGSTLRPCCEATWRRC